MSPPAFPSLGEKSLRARGQSLWLWRLQVLFLLIHSQTTSQTAWSSFLFRKPGCCLLGVFPEHDEFAAASPLISFIRVERPCAA